MSQVFYHKVVKIMMSNFMPDIADRFWQIYNYFFICYFLFVTRIEPEIQAYNSKIKKNNIVLKNLEFF